MPRKSKPFDHSRALALYADGLSVKRVAAEVGSSQHAINKMLREAGVLRRKGGGAPLDETALLARYADVRSSQTVAAEFGCTPEYVLQLVRAAGQPVAARGGRRVYAYDAAFFDTYTPASCYWAGFLAADGSLVLSRGAHRVQVLLKRGDRAHLEAFARCAGSEHPVKDVVVAGVEEVQYVVSSREWWDALHARFRLTPRKTFTLQPPRLPDEMVWHFVRGYFDGDGCARGDQRQIDFSCGSRVFVEWLWRLCEKPGRIFPVARIWRFCISGKNMRAVVPRLYAGSTPDTRLTRKYELLKHLL